MGKKNKKGKTKVIGTEVAKLKGDEGRAVVGFTKLEDDLLWQLAEGITPSLAAKRMAPNDPVRQSRIRRRFYTMGERTDFQDELGKRARVIKILGIGAASKALIRKASAGRVDAIKLLYESTGYFNPRVTHDHGGEVMITIRNAPRPERVVEEYARDAMVVDAEVVE